MVDDGGLSALRDRGYAVVRGFLDDGDIAALVADYESGAYADNANYKLKNVGLEPLRRIRPRLDRLAAQVRAQSGVDVDLFNGATYFANDETVLGWHQEFEPFYLCQDLHNYLNFYLPFVKPDRTRSNLELVPFDALRARDATAYEGLVGSGARSYQRKDGATVVRDSTTGKRTMLGYELESIAVAPELDAGDLLLVRGDVIHRTQDQATRRVAISMRMVRGASEITRQRLAEGGLYKLRVMLKNRRTFSCAFDHFEELGSDRSTVERLVKHLRQRLPKYQPDARAMARMLAAVAPRFHLRSLWNAA